MNANGELRKDHQEAEDRKNLYPRETVTLHIQEIESPVNITVTRINATDIPDVINQAGVHAGNFRPINRSQASPRRCHTGAV